MQKIIWNETAYSVQLPRATLNNINILFSSHFRAPVQKVERFSSFNIITLPTSCCFFFYYSYFSFSFHVVLFPTFFSFIFPIYCFCFVIWSVRPPFFLCYMRIPFGHFHILYFSVAIFIIWCDFPSRFQRITHCMLYSYYIVMFVSFFTLYNE